MVKLFIRSMTSVLILTGGGSARADYPVASPLPNYVVHNRAPTVSDDGTHGYYAAGAVTRESCAGHGAGLTAAAFSTAPPGVNAYGAGRQAVYGAAISASGQVANNTPIDLGAGYNPLAPPAVTVAAFTGTTPPSGCTANVATIGSLWNVLGDNGRSVGQVYSMVDSTPGAARWRRMDMTGLVTDAVGGTPPLLQIGTKALNAAYTGPLFACLPPSGGALVPIPQNAAREADPLALRAYLTAHAATYCNATLWYNQDGSGNDPAAIYNATAASVTSGGTGFPANATNIPLAASGIACSPNGMPTFAGATNSSGVLASVTILNVGYCSASTGAPVTLTGSSGTGATLTLNWTQTGPSCSPQLQSGGILECEMVYNSANSSGPASLRPGLVIPATIAPPGNNFSILAHMRGESGHLAIYVALGGVSAVSNRYVFFNSIGQVSTGAGQIGVGAFSLSPQPVLATVAPTTQTFLNGGMQTTANFTGNSSAPVAGGTIGFGDNGAVAVSYMGMSAVVIWGRGLSATEQTAAYAADADEFNFAPQAVNVLDINGDSRVEGAQSTLNQGLCQKTEKLLRNPSVRIYCNGWYGQSIENMASNFFAQGNVASNPLAPVNLIVLDGSINDFGNDTPAQAMTAMQSWIGQAQQAGFKQIIGTTIYPKQANLSGYFGNSPAAHNAYLAYNTAMLVPGAVNGLTGMLDQNSLNQFGGSTAQYIQTANISAPGTGCVSGGLVTPIGGTLVPNAVAPTFTVTAAGGLASALTYVAGGPYATPPKPPVALTGSGCINTIAALSFGLNPLISSDGTHFGDLGYDADAATLASYLAPLFPTH